MSVLNELTTKDLEQNFPSLSFQVGRDRCSITAKCVCAIMTTPEQITHIPEAPGYCKGIINMRGQVIPMVDMRSIFGMPSLEMEQMDFSFAADGSGSVPAGQSISIVIEGGSYTLGLIVDQVHAVEVVAPISREQQSSIFSGSRYILDVGISDRTSENTLILDHEALLALCETLQY